jgi:hypothetical protein
MISLKSNYLNFHGHSLVLSQEFSPEQAYPTLYVVRKILAKFGLRAGNMKFNTQNKE